MRKGFSKDLIARILPNAKYTVVELEEKFPARDLPEGAIVTRFAPSPTGFMHIGGLYSSLIGRKLASQTGGVWYLRIEDTDTAREKEGMVDLIIDSLKAFGIQADEGSIGTDITSGDYGPYYQTQRKDIYHSVAADLLERGFAYPCFLTQSEMDEIRENQKLNGLMTGIYGEYAKWRDADEGEIATRLETGEVPSIRLYSTGNKEHKIFCKDEVRGSMVLPENNDDIVLIKSTDGLPTYHFAHLCDDHFMRSTHIVRAEEYFSTFPLHIQMFNMMDWNAPRYIHTTTLDKIDDENSGQRKLSKRKDPEASVRYFMEQGWPTEAVLEYIFNVLNPTYEEDKTKGRLKDIWGAELKIKKLPKSSALFDMKKLEWWAREFVANLPGTELAKRVTDWAEKYGNDFEKSEVADMDYLTRILSIERSDQKRVRKDFFAWRQTLSEIAFFFDNGQDFACSIASLAYHKEILKEFLQSFDIKDQKDVWWNKITQIASEIGIKNAEAAMVLRIAVTGRTMTPDLYSVMDVMGEVKVRERIERLL